MIEHKRIETPNEYRDLVAWYTFLLNKEFEMVEQEMEFGSPMEIAECIPKLISAVNVVGYLRGQDKMFIVPRPNGIDFQAELYKTEEFYEDRLWKLIDYVNKDEKASRKYRGLLEEYYVKSRGLRN